MLWLLPLAALARPRWRDQLVWQGGEIFYFAMVWWYLGGFLDPRAAVTPASTGSRSGAGAAELYLAGLVVRDVLRPWHDPVRRTEAGPSAR